MYFFTNDLDYKEKKMNTILIRFFGFIFGFFLVNGCNYPTLVASKRPNIIFIMSDDHAIPAISAYDGFLSKIFKTPNLDRLADEGMLFNNAFCTNSICTPSRAAILTGKYSHMNGVYTLEEKISDDEITFPKLLRDAGYYTGMIGKWHLHTEPKGFDYWKVMVGQGLYHNPVYCEKGKGWSRDPEGGVGTRYQGYVTDINTGFALEFLENRPKNKPFSLLLHYKAPHDEWEYSEKYETLLAEVDVPEPRTLYDDYNSRGRGIRACTQKIGENHTFYDHETGHLKGDKRKAAQYQSYIKRYLRCVASVDENVGRVLRYLDDNNLTENTIVVYTSDQGFYLGEHGMYDKRFMYEESLRIPFLIRYPKAIKAGTVNNDIVTNIDFSGTFLDYANIEIPDEIQGESLRDLVEGTTPDDWRQSMYYRYWMHGAHFNIPAHYGIRTQEYKLIYFYSKGLGYPSDGKLYPSGNWAFEGNNIQDGEPYWEMYDLKNDPNELNNLYDDPQIFEVRENLRKELFSLKDYYSDHDEVYPELFELTRQFSEKN